MTVGWAHPCTCGNAERGAYCPECRGFGDGFSGGTWDRPVLEPSCTSTEMPQREAPESGDEGETEQGKRTLGPGGSETWCPGGHRGATVRGNAAYCAECGGRLRPTSSYSTTGPGTGH